ncbi:hypothetical protein EPR50_G00192810 [Perca flavescens]|uniref:Uncharacterized protein n=1 Tax=Perca flavescens TaxID=8167 RepID=A0A484C5V3_PERFV|nr:uncharacterized protein LOC114546005 isoform X1 [Perca flavescens]XP_028420441.1 uncharacterized protein LOC114546005 isoform X1 [Perca flavescens]XP_028420442.1 uncharacterized protein LOC114546005 isoform X1 [Perca flavescens]TDG99330.1 hypothetical protein EPR50_G00192810 [Perca flavescens]
MANRTDPKASSQSSCPEEEPRKPGGRRPRRRAAAFSAALSGRGQRAKRRGQKEKGRGQQEKGRSQKEKRRCQEEKKEGVTVKRTYSDGKRRWDKKHYCVFCRRPQVKIARHLLRKHSDQQEVAAASALPTGSKQRHLLLEHLRCRGNYLHNIEVIRQGSGEIVPWRQPSEEVDARNYLPCPLCLGFFLRADLWKHQASCRKKLTPDPSRDPTSTTDPSRDPTSTADTTTDPSSDPTSTSDTTTDPSRDPTSTTTNPCTIDPSRDPTSTADTTTDPTGKSACDPADNAATEDAPSDPLGDKSTAHQTGTKRPVTSDPRVDHDVTCDPGGAELPRKRSRVQAAASRLLPISSGASESCSEVLHRMNQDHVSHQVKSDWLICKYGNKLMGNQDGSQRRYDYVSQKLRELGRFVLAAISLDSGVRTLQDLLAPGRLSLVLAAARKASGYRWSRPPLAVKTTLKTVCEIAIGETLQDGDWEAAAKTTDFYHLLGREWDNLGLLDPDHHTATSVEDAKLKKRSVQSISEKCKEPSNPRPEVPAQSSNRPLTSMIQIESRLQTPITVPVAPRKVRRRPWSSAEKEAVWRQLGVHVLVQSVPGKEICQRCLDLEPVLRGRHWKDIKNQVHNQIQSQKKQQFHAQMDLQDNQEQQEQIQNHKKQYQAQVDQHGTDHNQKNTQMDQQDQDNIQNQKKQQYHTQMDLQDQDNIQNQKKQQYHTQMDLQDQDNIQNQKKQQYHTQMDLQDQDNIQNQKKQQYHTQMDLQDQDNIQNQKKQQYHTQMDLQDQDNIQNQKKQQYHTQMDLEVHKKQLCHARIAHQDQIQIHKKQLYPMGEHRDTSVLTGPHYGSEGPHRAPGQSLLEREPGLSPYQLPHRTLGPHMDQLLSRTEWTDESLAQHYSVSRQLDRNLQPNPHSGHVHF